MKTLGEIKEERAHEMDYSDWEEFIYRVDDPNILDMEFDEVAKRYAKEVAREALKNASDEVAIRLDYEDYDSSEWINKRTILDEQNIPEL